MDLQNIFISVFPLVFIAIGWFCKEIWSAVQQLKKELAQLRNHVSENFMRRDDFSERWDEIIKSLHRLEDKLDKMKDK